MGERGPGLQETPVERDPGLIGSPGVSDRPMAMYTPGREGVYYDAGGSWIAVAILLGLVILSFGAIALYYLWR